jgi:branched-subunit amino acid aminotransferase/4-amino-4-deoxychorismate lyase
VLEATVANVFLALDGELVTPPLDTGVLPGIVRGVLLADLERRLVPAVRGVVERPVVTEDLARASEVLLTSSLVGVLGADRILGTVAAAHLPGRQGPVAEALGRRLGEILGSDH